jgi:ADP-ribose pyrophosphatase YjhB (NUDIX family)
MPKTATKMGWEQKFLALQSLLEFRAGAAIRRRETPHPWYLSLPGVEVKRGRMLHSPCGGGQTPEEAIHVAWEEYTALEPGEYLVISAGTSARRALRWDRTMWRDVQEQQ